MIYFDSIDSTNAYAKAHFSELLDGDLVAAGMQSHGRGRLGRPWVSSPGNIFASFVVRGIDSPFLGVVASSLATLDLVSSLCPGHSFYIKWPNDIFSHRSKIAGILAEYVHVSDNPADNGLIVGIGVNVAMSEQQLASVGQPAASVFSLSGSSPDISSALRSFESLLKDSVASLRRDPSAVFRRWKSGNALLGKLVDFDSVDGSRITCRFVDIDDDGTAVVVMPDGSRANLNCGDVRLHWSEP